MIVKLYQDSQAVSSYYQDHFKYSKFRDKQVILLEVRDTSNLEDFLNNCLSNDEKDEINTGKKVLLVNCSQEAVSAYNFLKDRLPVNKEFCKIISGSPDIKNDEIYTIFEKITKGNKDASITSPLECNPSKLYINFNKKPREHRVALLLLLKQFNLLEKGYNSFQVQDFDLHFLSNLVKNKFSTITCNASNILELTGLCIDKINIKDNLAFTKPSKISSFMCDSLISLVTETNYFYNEPRFLTEKTFRPIAFKQPFILVTVPNSLEFLKTLGYKTFDGIIDESYDKEYDDYKRLTMVVKELERLSQLKDFELNRFKLECAEIVEYNYNNLINKKNFII